MGKNPFSLFAILLSWKKEVEEEISDSTAQN